MNMDIFSVGQTADSVLDHLRKQCESIQDPGKKAAIERTIVQLSAGLDPDMIPSYHGEYCPYNGDTGLELACDECDHYMTCFTDYAESL